MLNTHGSSAMTVNGVTVNDGGLNGTSCAAKPNQAFYQTTLGWDFNTVWRMGSNGYPALR
jgi:hypothetical protein